MLTNYTTTKSGLYIIHLSDTHYYGGRSVDCKHRWQEHLRDLRAGKHYNKRMQAVFDIHGMFAPEIITPWEEGMDLEAVEQHWLDENFRKPGCVNLTATSDGGGAEWSNETRQKILRILETPERRQKSRDTINKNRQEMSIARWTPEAKQDLREQNSSRRGILHTPEHKAKIAEAGRGRKNTPGAIQNMSEAAKIRAKAYPMSQETRELQVAQHKGRVWIHNGPLNRQLWPDEAEELIGQGWERGKVHSKEGPSKHKGLVWINDGVKSRRVRPEEADDLIGQGWLRGPSFQRPGRVTIHKGSVNRLVWPSEADGFLDQGWKKGRISSPQQKGQTWVHKDLVNRKVQLAEAEELVGQGWERGKTSSLKKNEKVMVRNGSAASRWVMPGEVEELLKQGWELGNQMKGRVWVNDGTKSRRVPSEEVEGLLGQGWVRGTAPCKVPVK